MKSVDEHVLVYGEQYRKLIVDSLGFLDEHECHWKLPKPMNRDKFIQSVMSRVSKPKEKDAKDEKRIEKQEAGN